MKNPAKPRLKSIEYIRGISMLGVAAIHIGSQYLMNPTPNLHLVALFEIVSRFSVPIFFFISAFGLFYKIDLAAPFDYENFLRRRFKAVLVPYLLWSIFYVIHDNFFYGSGIPAPGYALEILFFGLAKYQLYFLVILIWFYLLMPIWIKIVREMTAKKFAAIFFLQILFNCFSSYDTNLTAFVNSLPDDSILKMFLMWRLNWLVLHYVFIFLLGAILAVNSGRFFRFMKDNKKIINASFALTLTMLLSWFYFLIYRLNYSPTAAVNTAHQLSPPGFLYTIAASIFFFMLFENFSFGEKIDSALKFLGKHSFFVYLFHPIPIAYLLLIFGKLNLVMNSTNAIILYFLTVLISLAAAKFKEKFQLFS